MLVANYRVYFLQLANREKRQKQLVLNTQRIQVQWKRGIFDSRENPKRGKRRAQKRANKVYHRYFTRQKMHQLNPSKWPHINSHFDIIAGYSFMLLKGFFSALHTALIDFKVALWIKIAYTAHCDLSVIFFLINHVFMCVSFPAIFLFVLLKGVFFRLICKGQSQIILAFVVSFCTENQSL